MLDLAKEKFGDINSEYFFLGLEFKDDGPRIRYQAPNYIVIHLTPNSLENEFLAYFQLSHEVYHLLSPTGKYDANNLEEGLAVYFSKFYLDRFTQSVFSWEAATLPNSNYYNAYKLVDKLLQIDPHIIKTIRTAFPKIKTSHLTIKEFEEVIKDDLPIEILIELLKPFPYTKNVL